MSRTKGPLMTRAKSFFWGGWWMLWFCSCRSGNGADEDGVRAGDVCGMSFSNLQNAGLISRDGIQIVEFSGRTAAFVLQNPSDSPNRCTFRLEGKEAADLGLFTRFHQETEHLGKVEVLAPGRLQITQPVQEHADALFCVEPIVDAPEDFFRVGENGLTYVIEGGAYLRKESGVLLIRSLGAEMRVRIRNTNQGRSRAELLIENSSDRLSVPAMEGLSDGKMEREGKRLKVTGALEGQAEGSFVLKARPLPDVIPFLYAGDSREHPEVFVRLLKEALSKSDPLFLIMGGDLSMDSRPEELDRYLEAVDWVPFPIYYGKGNHDNHCQGYKHYRRLFGPEQYSVRIGPLAFFILDSNRYRPEGFTITNEQQTWLKQTLESQTDARWKFFVLHAPPHPLHGPSIHVKNNTNLDPATAESIKALARKNGVSYVLSGHAHVFARGEEEGVIYLTSGGAGAASNGYNPVPGFIVSEKKHLMIFEAGPEGVRERIVELSENE
jgi:hypothetical protein